MSDLVYIVDDKNKEIFEFSSNSFRLDNCVGECINNPQELLSAFSTQMELDVIDDEGNCEVSKKALAAAAAAALQISVWTNNRDLSAIKLASEEQIIDLFSSGYIITDTMFYHPGNGRERYIGQRKIEAEYIMKNLKLATYQPSEEAQIFIEDLENRLLGSAGAHV